MPDAAVLKGGKVIRLATLIEPQYDSVEGFLIRFKKGEVSYINVKRGDFRQADEKLALATPGYYEQEKFLKYLVNDPEYPLTSLSTFQLIISDSEEGVYGDNLIAKKILITTPYNILYQVSIINWTYTKGQDTTLPTAQLNIPGNATVISQDVVLTGIPKLFYDRNIDFIKNSALLAGSIDTAVNILVNSAIRIDLIQKDIFSFLGGTPDFDAYIASQEYEWSSTNYFTDPSLALLQDFNNKITNFYKSAFSNKQFIQTTTGQTKLYWLASTLSVNSLTLIPTYNKIQILELIIKGVVLGAVSSVVPFTINEEEFALNIVKSIGTDQGDEFFQRLISFSFLQSNNSITLFQALYDKIDDVGIGASNLKILMNEFYRIFLFSSYNPYNLNGSTKNSLINPNNYANKPVMLDYESGEFLGIFHTSNYDFRFNKNKIEVYYSTTEGYGETTSEKITIIGSYGIFQTLTIVNTDSNTNSTKFAAVKVGNSEQAAIPIFYLKYIDDKKTTENIITTVKISIDIALTLSAVGNLAKLRHLRSLNLLGRVALGLEGPGEELVAYELFQGATAVVELTTSALNIFLDYSAHYEETYCLSSSPKYSLSDCKFYRELANFSMILQLVFGSIDIATSRQLQNTSRKLLSGPLPDDFAPEGIAILEKFAQELTEIKDLFRVKLIQRFGENSSIWQKISSNQFSQHLEEFLLDFGKADVRILDQLNSEIDLINYWEEIKSLKGARKDINFLKDYKAVITHPRLTTHIHSGHYGVTPSGGAYVNGGHNPILLLQNQGSPPRWRWVDPNSVLTNKRGYQYGKVERNMSDVSWQGGNPPSPWKVKKDESTFWPFTDTQRINEEMSFSLSNKKFERFDNVTKNELYKGKASDGQPIQIVINPKTNGIVTIYPIMP